MNDAAHDLYASLTLRRFTLRADGDRLFVEPRADLLPEDIERIKEHKPFLMEFIASRDAATVDENGQPKQRIPCPQCARQAALQHRATRVYFCAWCRKWIEKQKEQ